MALSQYRVRFLQPFASYNAGEVPYFTGNVAQALVDGLIATAVDALPATAVRVPKGPARHMARAAHAAEPVTAEADRQLLAAQVAAL